MDGVSTLDLVLIQRHMLGMTELDSPYKLIAADVNGNESISAADLLQLRKMILGLYADSSFPNNESWRFLDDGFQFVDLTRPFPFNEVIHVENLPHSMYNQNFVAVKVGDVNNSVQASIMNGAQTRSKELYNLVIDDKLIQKGELVEVPITVAEAKGIYGFQFSLGLNSEFVRNVTINTGVLDIAGNNYTIDNGLLKVSWNKAIMVNLTEDEVLFTVAFEANETGRLSQALNTDDQTINSEIYNEGLKTDELAITCFV